MHSVPSGRRATGLIAASVAVLGALTLTWTALALDGPATAPIGRLPIDAAGLAHVETEGWRAYYDRAWPRAIALMLQLNHDQFGLGWPAAVEASYNATRAQIAFAGADNNVPLARDYLERYYAIVAHERGLRWDARLVADAEMRYWIVHRQVAQHPADPQPLIDALTDLHTLVFEILAAEAHASAVERTAAAQAVDRITSRRSTNIDADWREVESHLKASYSIVAHAMR